MPTIKETTTQMIQYIFPEYANHLGTLHGGRLMNWIMIVGGLAASRVSRGNTVLGSTDSIDFLNPVKVGEIVILDSWVEYVGESSLEVGVRVHSENTETGEKKLTTSSHLAYVAVDREGKPRSIKDKITPESEAEESVSLEAQKRKKERLTSLLEREKRARNTEENSGELSHKLETLRVVLPEDALHGNLMSVGKLMMEIDETAAILTARFVRGIIVTGSVDNFYLYSPIRVGEVITLKAGLNYVGNTSVEAGIKVMAEDLRTGDRRHTGTAFLNFVHLGEDGRPKPVPKFAPVTPTEIRRWRDAEERRERRTERVKQIKKSAAGLLL